MIFLSLILFTIFAGEGSGCECGNESSQNSNGKQSSSSQGINTAESKAPVSPSLLDGQEFNANTFPLSLSISPQQQDESIQGNCLNSVNLSEMSSNNDANSLLSTYSATENNDQSVSNEISTDEVSEKIGKWLNGDDKTKLDFSKIFQIECSIKVILQDMIKSIKIIEGDNVIQGKELENYIRHGAILLKISKSSQYDQFRNQHVQKKCDDCNENEEQDLVIDVINIIDALRERVKFRFNQQMNILINSIISKKIQENNKYSSNEIADQNGESRIENLSPSWQKKIPERFKKLTNASKNLLQKLKNNFFQGNENPILPSDPRSPIHLESVMKYLKKRNSKDVYEDSPIKDLVKGNEDQNLLFEVQSNEDSEWFKDWLSKEETNFDPNFFKILRRILQKSEGIEIVMKIILNHMAETIRAQKNTEALRDIYCRANHYRNKFIKLLDGFSLEQFQTFQNQYSDDTQDEKQCLIKNLINVTNEIREGEKLQFTVNKLIIEEIFEKIKEIISK